MLTDPFLPLAVGWSQYYRTLMEHRPKYILPKCELVKNLEFNELHVFDQISSKYWFTNNRVNKHQCMAYSTDDWINRYERHLFLIGDCINKHQSNASWTDDRVNEALWCPFYWADNRVNSSRRFFVLTSEMTRFSARTTNVSFGSCLADVQLVL